MEYDRSKLQVFALSQVIEANNRDRKARRDLVNKNIRRHMPASVLTPDFAPSESRSVSASTGANKDIESAAAFSKNKAKRKPQKEPGAPVDQSFKLEINISSERGKTNCVLSDGTMVRVNPTDALILKLLLTVETGDKKGLSKERVAEAIGCKPGESAVYIAQVRKKLSGRCIQIENLEPTRQKPARWRLSYTPSVQGDGKLSQDTVSERRGFKLKFRGPDIGENVFCTLPSGHDVRMTPETAKVLSALSGKTKETALDALGISSLTGIDRKRVVGIILRARAAFLAYRVEIINVNADDSTRKKPGLWYLSG